MNANCHLEFHCNICLDGKAKSNFLTTLIRQECIPVGCVPPASVAATRCHYQAVSVLFHIDPPSQKPETSRQRPPRQILPDRYCQTDSPRQRLPFTETPLSQIPPFSQRLPWRETPGKKMGPGIEIPPQKEHGTRQPDRKRHHTETSTYEQNDWHVFLKILPWPKLCLRACNKKEN